MTVRDTDVAVIGVSFELPGCSRWEELERVLSEGRDRVSAYPSSRAEQLGLVRGERDARGCWQERIGDFDHEYFALSRAEAGLIDPRQRRTLTLAVDAIGRAGYAPKELRGRNVAVVVAGYCGILPSLLHLLTDEERNTGRAFAGSLPAYAAGRVSYHLDLRGPAFVVDTACSSFLVALHEARWKLARSESELALVGGYAAMLGDIPAAPVAGEGLGVNSPSGRCLSFDADADGTVIGEGGGFVLLKRLDAALRDGDTIHAVIRGSALNQDAGRSNGLTAPSPPAQADVIRAALRDADVDPATVGYVEAHGTGTRVGDPIEMQALAETYGSLPAGGGSRPVSSVKANFGHLDAMAGFAGLIRVIAQFRAGHVFPTANFTRLNPLIDLAGVPLHVAAAAEEWSGAHGPRRAGISSFGLSGTNAHVIVEEGPPQAPPVDATGRGRLVVASAPDRAGLRELTGELLTAVTSGAVGLDAIADVLAVGREPFAHRAAWIARDSADLAVQLRTALAEDADRALPPTPLLVALGESPVTDAELDRLAAAHTVVADLVERAQALTPRRLWSAGQRALVALAGRHAVLDAFGVSGDPVLAHGAGAVAHRLGAGLIGLAEAMAADGAADGPPDRARLLVALDRFGPRTTLVDLGPGGELSQELRAVIPESRVVTVRDSADELLRLLHLQGRSPDWGRGLGPVARRAGVPVAPLREQPCWPRLRARVPETAPVAAESAEPVGEVLDDTPLTIEETILEITRELLGEPVTLDDDFLESGGDSLSGALLVARVNKRFGTALEVLDLYDLHGLAALAERIGEALGTTPSDIARNSAAQGAPNGPEAASPPSGQEAGLSGQQAAIWTAVALDPESDSYSVPAAFLLRGEADEEWLDTALSGLVARHGMLRAVLRDTDDGPRQYVTAPTAHPRPLRRRELDLTEVTAARGRDLLSTRLRELIAEPFRLYDEPPYRFHLVRVRFRDSEQRVLLLNFHHLFFDGWSWGLALAQLCGAEAPSAVPGADYLDHVRAQSALLDGERGEELRRFWAGYLDGAVPGSLPGADGTARGDDPGGADVTLAIGDDLAVRLRETVAADRSSLNMLFTAAWAALLWQISGDTDLCVAMPVANRGPGEEQVIGCYANTVLVRIRVDPRETFGDLLAQARESSLRAIAHGDFPADRILSTARHPSGRPLAATMLGFQLPQVPRRLGGTGALLDPLDVRQSGAQFPLELTVLDGGRDLALVLKYATGRFDPGTASALLDRFAGVLGRIAGEGVALRLDALADDWPAPRSVPDLPDFDF
ncbi:condensation domain-containing protein [Streptomyces clavuligerus]|uniref:Hybrid PKS / NRPS n=1 Tax=Streptomyces clavuligerus TaxID=1901 RepID=D5SIQ2_STRCL|nr:condensation domain-containing protein [Streptomyces clavuligerus]EFG03795.1 Hybrid PKS / NRPS [Streptomyces clavuligerus]MBY6307674.1 peptide synthetase [Streptomyces clavuligerus]QCS09779.1 peptide synthetase [Streptomyces clavuligerus]QPJ98179.1 peptide synthetase [Streptomyces clavuligerus]WDN56484.1 condensation domain-containing protein [Streptomyces clavuligerus]